MPYQLPNKMPEEITIGAKTFKRVGGKLSVTRGVCKSNDGSWHYYFNKQKVDQPGPLGQQRHFSVHTATGQRSVHISMKSHGATGPKRDNIMIWYRYDEQWTGNEKGPVGWGRTRFNHMNQTRLTKACDVLKLFLEAMTRAAEGGVLPAIQPNLTPVVSATPTQFNEVDWEEAERAFELKQKVQSSEPVTFGNSDVDDWEDL